MNFLRSDRLRRTSRLLMDAVDSFSYVHAFLTAEYVEPYDLFWKSNGRSVTTLADGLLHLDRMPVDRIDADPDGHPMRFSIDVSIQTGKSWYAGLTAMVPTETGLSSYVMALLRPDQIGFLTNDMKPQHTIDFRMHNKFRIDFQQDGQNRIQLSISAAGSETAISCFDDVYPFSQICFTIVNGSCSLELRRTDDDEPTQSSGKNQEG